METIDYINKLESQLNIAGEMIAEKNAEIKSLQERLDKAHLAVYHYSVEQAPLAPATDAPTIPPPLAEKDAEIAALKAENERLMRGMDETLNVVQEYQKVAIHPSDVTMFKHIANTLVRSMLAQEQPAAPQLAPTPAQEVTAKYKVNDLVTVAGSDWPRCVLKVYVSQEQGKVEYLLEGISNRWYQEGELREHIIFDNKNKGA